MNKIISPDSLSRHLSLSVLYLMDVWFTLNLLSWLWRWSRVHLQILNIPKQVFNNEFVKCIRRRNTNLNVTSAEKNVIVNSIRRRNLRPIFLPPLSSTRSNCNETIQEAPPQEYIIIQHQRTYIIPQKIYLASQCKSKFAKPRIRKIAISFFGIRTVL